MSFADLGLIEPILRALAAKSYDTPTPIQQRAIPPLLEGRDLLGIAQTGTGKTAAFALPILQYLAGQRHRPRPRCPNALVLTPTRELAAQIGTSFQTYGANLPLRHTVIFGGVGQTPQVHALQRGVDVLVATPGRLLDLIDQRHVFLDDVEVFVLDEADRMLDMGFVREVRRVIDRLPKERQSLLFSATMPDDIVQLAGKILRDPVRVEVTPPATTVERIEQSVYMVEKADKPKLLWELLQDPAIEMALIFTRTKHGADRVVKHLRKLGEPAEAIHGNKSQGAREKALAAFRSGKARVLVATDIAARGIDVPGISHVINFDLPNVPESYVHRIGRTARAGRDGVSFSFCATDERPYLRDIEKLTRRRIAVVSRSGRPVPVPAAAPVRAESTPTPAPARPAAHRQRPAEPRRHDPDIPADMRWPHRPATDRYVANAKPSRRDETPVREPQADDRRQHPKHAATRDGRSSDRHGRDAARHDRRPAHRDESDHGPRHGEAPRAHRDGHREPARDRRDDGAKHAGEPRRSGTHGAGKPHPAGAARGAKKGNAERRGHAERGGAESRGHADRGHPRDRTERGGAGGAGHPRSDGEVSHGASGSPRRGRRRRKRRSARD